MTSLVPGANDTELYLFYANDVNAVPEPSTFLLGIVALGGLGAFAWRRKASKRAA